MNFLVYLENKGHSKVELRNVNFAINKLNKNADRNSTEAIEQYVAKLNCKNTYKRRLCYVYKQFCNYKKIEWKTPHYTKDATEIRIPTHEKIEMIIADSGKTLALKIKLSMETGLRPIELQNLKVKDFDLQQKQFIRQPPNTELQEKSKYQKTCSSTSRTYKPKQKTTK